eukprot:Skav211048  [mRNA]  locus=scaffold1351:19410:19769:+ [translate_table: standard]
MQNHRDSKSSKSKEEEEEEEKRRRMKKNEEEEKRESALGNLKWHGKALTQPGGIHEFSHQNFKTLVLRLPLTDAPEPSIGDGLLEK